MDIQTMILSWLIINQSLDMMLNQVLPFWLSGQSARTGPNRILTSLLLRSIPPSSTVHPSPGLNILIFRLAIARPEIFFATLQPTPIPHSSSSLFLSFTFVLLVVSYSYCCLYAGNESIKHCLDSVRTLLDQRVGHRRWSASC